MNFITPNFKLCMLSPQRRNMPCCICMLLVLLLKTWKDPTTKKMSTFWSAPAAKTTFSIKNTPSALILILLVLKRVRASFWCQPEWQCISNLWRWLFTTWFWDSYCLISTQYIPVFTGATVPTCLETATQISVLLQCPW